MIIRVAIPAMNEADFIKQTLDCLMAQQVDCEVYVYVCVNQPEKYWDDEDNRVICENNQRTLVILKESNIKNITVIDRCSKGKGWDEKKFGVGIARKVLMDYISESANPEDIVISLDADTQFDSMYFNSVLMQFGNFPKAVALSVPYFHRLTGSEAEDRAILRYEIYMRNYAIQMLLIDSPFAFTALGSAMAYRVSAYRAIGGMSPMKSGEDFYFLQQMKKYGQLIIANDCKVYPAARFSNRVFFGTGPAMIKGNNGDWSSYPIYLNTLFLEIKILFDLMLDYFDKDIKIESAFYSFLQNQFKDVDFLTPLKKNSKSCSQFYRAFYTKVDGLRILQFLKNNQPSQLFNDRELIQQNYSELKSICEKYPIHIPLIDFAVSDLSEIRDQLVRIEEHLMNQKQVL